MQTLVVLSALAAITIASPALSDNHYIGYNPASYQITPTFRREKKFIVESNKNAAQSSEVQLLPPNEINYVAEVSGRTFGLKKPVIVKNKLGYHLYRDSDEEQDQADSQEKCTKEVKVKLCDAENVEARSNDLKEKCEKCKADLNQSENDMVQSIKKAKQTVEQLQHMKHDWKHIESRPDGELHKDIEVARQALEHIQQNLGNLESMNMRAATFSNAEALQGSHLQMTTEQRIAQWKEVMNNIQQNPEIARNLEDNFTGAKDQAHTSHMRETNLMKQANNELENFHDHDMKIKSSFNDDQSNMDKLDAQETKTKHAPTLQKHFETHLIAKMAEHLNSDHQHHLDEALTFPVHARNWQANQMVSMKNAAIEKSNSDLQNTDMQRTVTIGLPMSHHNMMPMHNHHHQQYHQPHFPSVDHEFHHQPHPHDFHYNFHGHGMHFKDGDRTEIQEKAAEMDNTAQGTLKMKQEQMVAARGAYGSYGLAGASAGVVGGSIGASAASLAGGSSGGPSAIGVYPHANLGGCAIPLLLSCSPSVVSGSVAKAHSGYGGSVYRAGQNFQTKRDTKKSHKIPATKAK